MNKTERDLVQVCIHPRSQVNMTEIAIGSIREQNPSLNVSVNLAGGAVIRGASEAELRLALDLIERFHTAMEIGPLQVVHRMSVTNSVEVD